MVAEAKPWRTRQIRAICLCDQLGMSRDERIEFARLVLHSDDIDSFNHVGPAGMETLIEALEGAVAFVTLMTLRVNIVTPPPPAEAISGYQTRLNI